MERMASSQAVPLTGIQLQLIQPARPPASPPSVEAKGAVFTKPWVVDLILDLAGYTSDKNLVDLIAMEPAAGDGAFLGPMIERLVDSCQRLNRPLSDCTKSLVAFELDNTNAVKSRAIAREVLLRRGADPVLADRLPSLWIKSGDYLLDTMNLEADFVIGNPPYVRLEDIPEETAAQYRDIYQTMRGRADLYIGFFEAALRQLKPGGVCAYICADRWMRNQYGSELRRLITSSFAVDVVIEMHNADAFHEEVDAYPAIAVIRRQIQTSSIVARAGLDAAQANPQELSRALEACRENQLVALPRGLSMARVDSWFKGADPWPCTSPEQLALLRRIEDRFAALETSAKVGIGVATGNDRIFITKDAGLVEPSRLLKLALAGDLANGRMVWSGHYLVNPWDEKGLVSLDEFPGLRSYFGIHAVALRNRHVARNASHAWYKTIDRVNHALTTQPKLYIPDIKNTLSPVLDHCETYPHHNLYFIQSDVWDLEALGALLMSAIGQFFVESYGVRMRGGYLRFQAQYLRRVRLPNPDSLSANQTQELREAFRARDKDHATNLALKIYQIERSELERAFGH